MEYFFSIAVEESVQFNIERLIEDQNEYSENYIYP